MNAPEMRIGKPAAEPKEFRLDELSRIRLEMASRIAAGLASDGNQRDCYQWEGETARAALRVADKLLALVVSGGC